MASYSKFVLTDKGRLLLNKMIAGECDLIATKAATGDGETMEGVDLKKWTELKNQRQVFGISSFSRMEDKICIRFVISNYDPGSGAGLEEEYRVQEIGVFAEDPEEGEILYAVSIADAGKGDFIPAYDETSPVTVTVNAYLVVGNGGNVLIRVSPDAYATAADVEELRQRTGSVETMVEEMVKNCPYESIAPIEVSGGTILHGDSGVIEGNYGDASNQTPSFGGTFKVICATVNGYGHVTGIEEHTVTIPEETKNTAGSTGTSSKIYLIGATSQAANPKTYSHDTAYVGTDGHLYSNSKQVVNLSDPQALTNKTYEGYSLGSACSRDATSSVYNNRDVLISTGGIYSYCQPAIKHTDVSFTTKLGPNPEDSAVTSQGYVSLTGTGYNKHVFTAQIIKAWPVSDWTGACVTIVKTDFSNTYPAVQLRAEKLQNYQITVRFFYTDNKWNNTADK